MKDLLDWTGRYPSTHMTPSLSPRPPLGSISLRLCLLSTYASPSIRTFHSLIMALRFPILTLLVNPQCPNVVPMSVFSLIVAYICHIHLIPFSHPISGLHSFFKRSVLGFVLTIHIECAQYLSHPNNTRPPQLLHDQVPSAPTRSRTYSWHRRTDAPTHLVPARNIPIPKTRDSHTYLLT